MIELLETFNNNELEGLRKYLDHRNKRHDVRNLELLRLLRTGDEKKLQKKIGTNAYHALLSRFRENLVDFSAGLIMDQDLQQEMKIIKWLMVARKLFAHEKFKSGFKLLKKAEELGNQLENYSLLTEIYHTWLENAVHSTDDPADLFARQVLNQQKLLDDERLNAACALIQQIYHRSEKSGEGVELSTIINTVFDQFQVNSTLINNYRTLYRLVLIADLEATAERSFHKIDPYFDRKMEALKKCDISTKERPYQLELYYLMANISFRRRLFRNSINYLNELEVILEVESKLFGEQKITAVKVLKALNYNYLGDHLTAAEILDEIITTHSDGTDTAILTRAMIHFQQGQHKAARQMLAKLQRTDIHYQRQNGTEWLLKKKFMELLLAIELGDDDLAESLQRSIVAKFRDYLKQKDQGQIIPFLKIIDKYRKNTAQVATEKFRHEIEQTIFWKPEHEEDLFHLSFYAWLKSKTVGRDVYTVTLELIGGGR